MITEEALRRLWKEAFGDTDAFLDGFFSVGFSPDRVLTATESDQLLGALYWFDCSCNGKKLAYVYAVATAESHRGKGVCHRLMEQLHRLLARQGYAGALLVPAHTRLAGLYESMGYRPFGGMTALEATAGGNALSLKELTPEAYGKARQEMLPPDAVLQEGSTLAFLATYARFYTTGDALFAVTVEKDTAHFQEFLGSHTAIPGILQTLGAQKGRYLRPSDRLFAMALPLSPDCPTPSYLGIPLD